MKRVIVLGLSMLLAGCPNQQKQHLSAFPAGSWMLLNPEDYLPAVIYGALMVCPEKGGGPDCKPGHTAFTLIEENRGHGCTDYIAEGQTLPVADSNEWQLKLNGDFAGVLRRQGQELVFTDADDRTLRFTARTDEQLDQALSESCDRSLARYKAKKATSGRQQSN